jgi:hypothetical protein
MAINVCRILTQLQEIGSVARPLLVHVGEMIGTFERARMALLAVLPEEIGHIRHRDEGVVAHPAILSSWLTIAALLRIGQGRHPVGQRVYDPARNREMPDGPPGIGLIEVPAAHHIDIKEIAHRAESSRQRVGAWLVAETGIKSVGAPLDRQRPVFAGGARGVDDVMLGRRFHKPQRAGIARRVTNVRGGGSSSFGVRGPMKKSHIFESPA